MEAFQLTRFCLGFEAAPAAAVEPAAAFAVVESSAGYLVASLVQAGDFAVVADDSGECL